MWLSVCNSVSVVIFQAFPSFPSTSCFNEGSWVFNALGNALILSRLDSSLVWVNLLNDILAFLVQASYYWFITFALSWTTLTSCLPLPASSSIISSKNSVCFLDPFSASTVDACWNFSVGFFFGLLENGNVYSAKNRCFVVTTFLGPVKNILCNQWSAPR